MSLSLRKRLANIEAAESYLTLAAQHLRTSNCLAGAHRVEEIIKLVQHSLLVGRGLLGVEEAKCADVCNTCGARAGEDHKHV